MRRSSRTGRPTLSGHVCGRLPSSQNPDRFHYFHWNGSCFMRARVCLQRLHEPCLQPGVCKETADRCTTAGCCCLRRGKIMPHPPHALLHTLNCRHNLQQMFVPFWDVDAHLHVRLMQSLFPYICQPKFASRMSSSATSTSPSIGISLAAPPGHE